jgi:hypothetical protein
LVQFGIYIPPKKIPIAAPATVSKTDAALTMPADLAVVEGILPDVVEGPVGTAVADAAAVLAAAELVVELAVEFEAGAVMSNAAQIFAGRPPKALEGKD